MRSKRLIHNIQKPNQVSLANISSQKGGNEFTTLIDILKFRALHQSDVIAYTFLVDGEDEQLTLTYSELDFRARIVAAKLCSLRLRGEPVLLLFPSGLEFMSAFLGALYAGVIAIPLYPPHRNRFDERLSAVIQDSGARHALTSSDIICDISRYIEQTPRLAQIEFIATDAIFERAPVLPENLIEDHMVSHKDLAFLQYTSGSTGMPKGVMVTHASLMANLCAIQQSFGHTDKLCMMGWLPLFHDMGLVGNALQPLYVGGSLVFMSPMHFLQNPMRWLRAISKHRATTSGGPNFAYDYCVNRSTLEQRAGLDLSCWEVAFNGAEPVQLDTLDRFAVAFKDQGFRKAAFFPCYGMAETTLLLGAGVREKRPVYLNLCSAALANNQVQIAQNKQPYRSVVGCGQIAYHERVVIVAANTTLPCEPNQVGEIWVACDSVALGYWKRSEESQAKFQARLPGIDVPFLRTGDLGFVWEGEIFVTGRLKDLIIIRGINHYPQDIEKTVEIAHDAVREGCSVAFSVEVEREEKLVIVLEIERSFLRTFSPQEVRKAIQKSVFARHDLRPHAICLLRPGGTLKTSSGKIRRADCRAGFLRGDLNQVDENVPLIVLAKN